MFFFFKKKKKRERRKETKHCHAEFGRREQAVSPGLRPARAGKPDQAQQRCYNCHQQCIKMGVHDITVAPLLLGMRIALVQFTQGLIVSCLTARKVQHP